VIMGHIRTTSSSYFCLSIGVSESSRMTSGQSTALHPVAGIV
jgi:hypothetical protein